MDILCVAYFGEVLNDTTAVFLLYVVSGNVMSYPLTVCGILYSNFLVIRCRVRMTIYWTHNKVYIVLHVCLLL